MQENEKEYFLYFSFITRNRDQWKKDFSSLKDALYIACESER